MNVELDRGCFTEIPVCLKNIKITSRKLRSNCQIYECGVYDNETEQKVVPTVLGFDPSINAGIIAKLKMNSLVGRLR